MADVDARQAVWPPASWPMPTTAATATAASPAPVTQAANLSHDRIVGIAASVPVVIHGYCPQKQSLPSMDAAARGMAGSNHDRDRQ